MCKCLYYSSSNKQSTKNFNVKSTRWLKGKYCYTYSLLNDTQERAVSLLVDAEDKQRFIQKINNVN